MAIPVLVTVELFPWNDLKGNAFEDSVRDFNGEVREYFADKVELLDVPHDMSNLTGTDTVYGTGTENVPYVAATIVVGFKGVAVEQAKELAGQFTTAKFNHVSAEVLDPDNLPTADAQA